VLWAVNLCYGTLVMRHMTPKLAPSVLQFDRHLARAGVAVGIVTFLCGLWVLLSIVSTYFGLDILSTAAQQVGEILATLGIVTIAIGALGRLSIVLTDPLRQQVQLAATSRLTVPLRGDGIFVSSEADIQPPPPRALRGATATTRRPSED